MSNQHLFLRIPYTWLLLAYSVIVFVVIQQLQGFLPAKAVFPWFWAIQLLAAVTSLLIHFRLQAAAKISGQTFVRAFMLTSALKLFSFMVIMVLFALVNRSMAFGFIFNFLIIYLLYTLIEVWVAFKAFGPSKS